MKKGRGLFYGVILAFVWRKKRTVNQYSRYPDKNRTEDLPNKKQQLTL